MVAATGMHNVHAMSRMVSACPVFTVMSPPSYAEVCRAHRSLRKLSFSPFLSGRSPFPDIEDGKSNDTYKHDCLEVGKNGMSQCQVAQENDHGCSEVEDSRSRKGDAALAAIGEDDPREKQGDEEKDRNSEDLVDGVCKGRVEVDQEDRDKKDGIGHFLDNDSPLHLFSFPVFANPRE